MLSYPLAPLLAVRQHKEELAQQAVVRAENTLLEARKALEKAKEDCKKYEEWVEQEIDRYYSEVIGELVKFKDLDSLKNKINVLLERVKDKYKAIDKAKDYVEACIEAKNKAIAHLTELRKQTAKLTKHKEMWEEEAKAIMEQREEVELEDFHLPEKEGIDE